MGGGQMHPSMRLPMQMGHQGHMGMPPQRMMQMDQRGGGLPPNMPQFMPSGPYPGMPGMGMNGVPGMHGGRPPNMPPNMHPGMPPNMPPHMMPGRGGGGGQMY